MRIFLLPRAVLFCYNICEAVLETAQYGKGNDIIMLKSDQKYTSYIEVLKSELVPAAGCTEPIAIAFAAAKAHSVLGKLPEKVVIYVSGNIIKNVKSVVVPNTGGLRGIEAAAAAGIAAGDASKVLEVIADVDENGKQRILDFLKLHNIIVRPADNDLVFDIDLTVFAGMFGEIASFLYCTCAIFYTFIKSKYNNTHKKSSLMSKIREMFKFSFPLTANRLLMHIFQSAEAVLVPAQLIVYGLSKSDSVSIYGILTGMAMPLILFPTALTNSLAVMLLPAVSELNLENNNKSIKSTINKCITFCISTGVLSTAIFIFYGSYAGAIVFNQPEVRNYVCILAWLCPFIYLTVTMGSILNGLGETTATCIQNISGIIVRLIFLVILVPKYGITMYMAGLLCSQILVCICHYIKLSRMLHIRMNAHGWFLIPGFFSLLSTGISLIFYKYISRLVSGLIPLFGGAVTACIIYIFLYATFYPYRNKPH